MHTDTHRRLEVVLRREIEAARSLAAALAEERTALTGNSPQAVIDTAAAKTALFGALEALDAERRQLCDAASIFLPSQHRGLTPLIAGASKNVAEHWRELLALIAGCRVANEVNGYIINARRGQIDQLLQLLRGGAPVIYGPQGRTNGQSRRALAWA